MAIIVAIGSAKKGLNKMNIDKYVSKSFLNYLEREHRVLEPWEQLVIVYQSSASLREKLSGFKELLQESFDSYRLTDAICRLIIEFKYYQDACKRNTEDGHIFVAENYELLEGHRPNPGYFLESDYRIKRNYFSAFNAAYMWLCKERRDRRLNSGSYATQRITEYTLDDNHEIESYRFGSSGDINYAYSNRRHTGFWVMPGEQERYEGRYVEIGHVFNSGDIVTWKDQTGFVQYGVVWWQDKFNRRKNIKNLSEFRDSYYDVVSLNEDGTIVDCENVVTFELELYNGDLPKGLEDLKLWSAYFKGESTLTPEQIKKWDPRSLWSWSYQTFIEETRSVAKELTLQIAFNCRLGDVAESNLKRKRGDQPFLKYIKLGQASVVPAGTTAYAVDAKIALGDDRCGEVYVSFIIQKLSYEKTYRIADDSIYFSSSLNGGSPKFRTMDGLDDWIDKNSANLKPAIASSDYKQE
jgi:hypothetical protein